MDSLQRVLIVDDEVMNLRVLSELLREEAAITLAKSGEQALRKAREQVPDLIVLDIKMPEMDGFETLTALRQSAITKQIPVIFISGLNDCNYEERGLLLGAADYIFKPFHHGIVKARVCTHLQLVKQRKMLERLANSDSLTGLANRRHYKQVFDQEVEQSTLSQSPISVAIFDIDNFKRFNDRYGHDAGDRLLQQVSKQLSHHFNHPRFLVSRFGGEEFVVLMPELYKARAFELVKGCLVEVAESCEITMSAGGVTVLANPDTDDSSLLSLADKALYLAKSRGKNCALWSDSSIEPMA